MNTILQYVFIAACVLYQGLIPDAIADQGTSGTDTLQFNASDCSVREDSGNVTLTVTRAEGTLGGTLGEASVSFQTIDGTDAIAGIDYTTTTGLLTWADGDAADKSFTIPIINRSGAQGDRVFGAYLFNASGAEMGIPSNITIIIRSVDTPGELRLSITSNSVNESVGNITVIVSRVNGTLGAASVDFQTLPGTAIAATDYIATNGTLSWISRNADTQAVTISIVNRAGVQGNRSFSLNITNAVGAALGSPSNATLTVTDQVSAVYLTADFDGDMKDDSIAVVGSEWYLWFNSGDFRRAGPYNLGISAMPAVGDCDGDQRADPWMMDTDGNWYVWLAALNFQRSGPYKLGLNGIPLVADVDGDRRADLIVYTADGNWHIRLTSIGLRPIDPIQFGGAGYSPAIGDLDRDGKADLAIMSSSGVWRAKLSSLHYAETEPINFGVAGTPLLGDYDSDGMADPTVVVGFNWYVWFYELNYRRVGPFPFPVP